MRKQSVLLLIIALLAGPIAGSVRAELVGHWPLNEGAGVTANDTSGYNNHGTLKNGPKWVAGALGQALELDGVDDFVEIPHSDSLTVSKEVTVTAWIRATQYTGTTGAEYQGIVAKSNSPRSYSLYLYSSGSLHFSTNGVGTMSTTKVPLNEWAHVAAEIVGGTQKYFINGVAAGVDGTGVTLPGASDQANVVIGKTWESSREFYGRIDDVRIYNNALDLNGVKKSMEDLPYATALVVLPADGAVIGQVQYTLKWEPGDFATTHQVYFGESFEAVEARQMTPVTTTTASLDVRQIPGYAAGMTPGKTYYWCVDEAAEGNPASPWKSPVWSFTVQPLKAWNPTPVDGGRYVLTDSTLTWNGGIGVIFHTLYLGTNREEVANGTATKRMVVTPAYTPEAGLQPGTTYYWRVDEFAGTTTHTGDIWSFTTLPKVPVTDSHLMGWWKLDEGAGSIAVDWSGHGNHGTIVGNPAWVDGFYGSALLFNTGKYVNCGVDAGASIKGDFTLASWVQLSPGNAGLYGGIGGRLVLATNYYGFSLVRHSSNVFRLWVGDGSASLSGQATSNNAYTDTEWHHIAGVRQGQANILFVDGVRQAASNNTNFVPSTEWFHIGRQYSHLDDRYFPGVIDDVRVYDVASDDAKIAQIMAGDPVLAAQPQPANGLVVDIRNVSDLAWTAGQGAVSHDVYFGTSRAAVANADRSSPEFVGNQADTGLSLAGRVAFGGGPYAWRVDEVEADGTTHKGYVWTFTVPACLIVDDFESYTDDEGSRIYEAWEDGLTNKNSTSVVGYAQAPFAEQKIVNAGRQSMPMDYDNTTSPYFAEAEMALDGVQNWTEEGVAVLSLAVRGNLDNGAGTLYVGLQDSTGKLAYVSNPDASILTSAAWTTWKVPLSQFGVKATAIKKIVVGVGNHTAPAAGGKGRIYIDDICLVRP